MKNKIIKLIKENRISTTEVADALGKKGVLPGILPINTGMHKVGELQFFYAYNNSNWELHEQIQDFKEGNIAYFQAINCGESALFGDLVSKYLILYKQAAAIVVDGNIRDLNNIIKEKYPLWAKGRTPIGCFNKKNEMPVDEDMLNAYKSKFDGSILVCDDSGVVIIEKEQINKNLLTKLEFIEFQEDVWYFCIDRHKMSTYETVCIKKYLEPNGLLDKESLEKLSIFSNKLNEKE